jgi:ABC-type lipopolysaccharide export system ATPase subunit
MLEADGIQLEFSGRKILHDIYIKCDKGKITALLGRNGTGKSCLMQIIYGSLPCEKSVRINNTSQYEAYKRPDLLRYLPQFNFIPNGLLLKDVFRHYALDYSLFEKRFPEFSSKYKTSVGSLSGGERRMIEIYAILKCKSQFAMLDEPFTHLNPLQIEKVKNLMLEEKLHKGLLITDHMFREVIEISDNIYVLANMKTHLTKSIQEIEKLGYVKL